MGDDILKRIPRLLGALSKGAISYEVEFICVETLKVLEIKKGFLRCSFIVTNRSSDPDGNWHPGAITTLVDIIGAAAKLSATGLTNVTVDLNLSFYSPAKIQEEVIVEAKVMGVTGKLSSVIIEIRRKIDGELLVLAKQWLTLTSLASPATTSKL
ncbi:hypothetical protein ACFE04_008430 [Oxalis oulophora]